MFLIEGERGESGERFMREIWKRTVLYAIYAMKVFRRKFEVFSLVCCSVEFNRCTANGIKNKEKKICLL